MFIEVPIFQIYKLYLLFVYQKSDYLLIAFVYHLKWSCYCFYVCGNLLYV